MVVEGPVHIIEAELPFPAGILASDIAQILLDVAVGGVAFDDHPVDETVNVHLGGDIGIVFIIGKIVGPAEPEQLIDLMVSTHGGLDNFHIVRAAAHVLGVHQFRPGFLDAVDAIVSAVDIENGEFIPLGQDLIGHIPGQGGKEFIAENGGGIVLAGPDDQRVVNIGTFLAVDRIGQILLAVSTAEIDFEAFLRGFQTCVAVHLDTCIDGKTAAVQLKKLQIAPDLPVGFVILVDAAAFGQQIRYSHQGNHRQGVIFIDDVGRGNDIAGELALLDAHKTEGSGLFQGDGTGIFSGIFIGIAAVGGVVELAFA